ncbi:solute carrier family 25 member 35-like [Cloeon dipterum]|uniref:solute carrier family 25 member 35-like n=1 Tax=Cloeon dipterum TaxID=197152 RepID=UPI003220268C
MEFLLGGVAAVISNVVCNPLDVVKIRMQLQGELLARGEYTVHYKNVFHAFYAIGKADGVLALQRGLVSSSAHQFILNAIRLGAFHFAEDRGWTTDETGNHTSLPKSALISSVAGGIGAIAGSPFYLVKTQMQSYSNSEIAVGHQTKHLGTFSAFKQIYGEHGLKGLWRGTNSAVPRMAVASAAQLTSYDIFKRQLNESKMLSNDHSINSFVASVLSSFVTLIVKTPFDVVSTRIYNQGVDAQGKGLLYSGVVDCFVKIVKKEGFFGLYKGAGAAYLRLGPHIIISLVVWDWLRLLYDTGK